MKNGKHSYTESGVLEASLEEFKIQVFIIAVSTYFE